MTGPWRGRVDDGLVCVKIRDAHLLALHITDFDFTYGVHVRFKRASVELK